MPAGRKLSMDELEQAHRSNRPQGKIAVVLDDVRSRHNVGSVFRTADSFGIKALHLCGLTPCPPHREIEKTALGATATVPWQHHADIRTCLEMLKAEGTLIIAVEQTDGSIPLDQFAPAPGPIAYVFGNELSGVSDHALALCDGAISIPQSGSKHSLNISVCAGIVLWHAAALLPLIPDRQATHRAGPSL